MIRIAVTAALCALALLAAAPARAQAPTAERAAPQAAPASASSRCVRRPRPVAAPGLTAPVTWREFEIAGELRDDPDTVRALFSPVMTSSPSLTETARDAVAATATKLGYQLVSLTTRDTPAGTRAVLRLAPLPIVREVAIDIQQSPFATMLDDQVRRRLRIRTGEYLAWDASERACALDDETARIAEYLHFDEGYFDAKVVTEEEPRGEGLKITLRIQLGNAYSTGVVRVANPEALAAAIDARAIVREFQHDNCLFVVMCFGSARFTRVQHTQAIARVVALLQRRGFPAARVHTSFEQDPASAFNRSTRAVDITVTVDPRRQIDPRFAGGDPDATPDTELREHLTFNAAASSDDVEAAASAQALAQHLQSRGWFDARVTWSRTRFQNPPIDRIWFQIDLGRQLPVRRIEFAGNRTFTAEQLEGVIGTTPEKLTTSLFGGNTNTTRAQLDADSARIRDEYRRSGFRDAQARVEVATDRAALGSVALTTALAAAERGNGLYVRYVIEEGEPTLLSRVELSLPSGPGDASANAELCTLALGELGELYGVELRADGAGCVATVRDVRYREDAVAQSADQLRSRLFSRGRPRAEVRLEVVPLGAREVAVRYTLAKVEPRQIGAVVIRGNFKTRPSIILSELGLRRGAPLTQDALAEGARRLRNTALFETVRITLPDLDTSASAEVNAVVEVVERYDHLLRIDAEAGYSSLNGGFLKLIPSFKNLFGVGMSFDVAGTVGIDVAEYLSSGTLRRRQLAAEATLRVPQWLSRRWSPVEFQTELTGFHRDQETARFGNVRTDGLTLTLSRTWERKRVGGRAARAITTGLHYDFRERERPIDVLRTVGADDDGTQVPISTRTGAVGLSFEWEQRVDRQGTLSPLAPESGFRLEAQVSLASRYLGGQDTFLKLSTAASRYWLLGGSLVLRADARYDQGVPLGGAVLLPEVERFFAGGDSTVRGYEDDRLATEVIQVGIPPIANVNQIRILPAGGNIRLMSSVDAQLRIYKLLATALFVDAGLITNQWGSVTTDDIRPSVGMALFRLVTPFGSFACERALPLRPRLGDDPRGRWHISFAARAQF